MAAVFVAMEVPLNTNQEGIFYFGSCPGEFFYFGSGKNNETHMHANAPQRRSYAGPPPCPRSLSARVETGRKSLRPGRERTEVSESLVRKPPGNRRVGRPVSPHPTSPMPAAAPPGIVCYVVPSCPPRLYLAARSPWAQIPPPRLRGSLRRQGAPRYPQLPTAERRANAGEGRRLRELPSGEPRSFGRRFQTHQVKGHEHRAETCVKTAQETSYWSSVHYSSNSSKPKGPKVRF